jgi:hypothetical protein
MGVVLARRRCRRVRNRVDPLQRGPSGRAEWLPHSRTRSALLLEANDDRRTPGIACDRSKPDHRGKEPRTTRHPRALLHIAYERP